MEFINITGIALIVDNVAAISTGIKIDVIAAVSDDQVVAGATFKGFGKADILQSFETRIDNDASTELATACAEVEKIALNRLKDMLPEA